MRATVRLERKRPDLPVYALIPPGFAAALGHETTFMAQVGLERDATEGLDLGRRAIKPWGDGRWFMEFRAAALEKAGLGPGDTVDLVLEPAQAVPGALMTAIAEAGLEAAWEALSPARRRALSETVFDARQAPTRARRIAAILDTLRR